ncbi:MAG: sulfite exporter TauE/SafE family protein [bacterium]
MLPSPWLLSVIGLLTGIMGGMLGIGGGVILIPLLVWVVKYDQRQAQGTSLALAIVVVLANLWNYGSQGYVYWDARSVLYCAVIGLGGAVAAAYASTWALKMSTHKLTQLFSILMLYAAGTMIYTGLQMSAAGLHEPVRPDIAVSFRTLVEFLGTGIAGGFASGFAGIGGNVVMVPLITEVLGVDQKYAQGFAVGSMLPIVFIGAKKYFSQGAGNLRTVLLLAPGSVVGVFVGGELLRRLTSPNLKLVFGVFLVVVAIWQFISGGPKPTKTAPSSEAVETVVPEILTA